jgi:hypothetical protein
LERERPPSDAECQHFALIAEPGDGVSGGTADQDETCAQAGIDAVKDVLK